MAKKKEGGLLAAVSGLLGGGAEAAPAAEAPVGANGTTDPTEGEAIQAEPEVANTDQPPQADLADEIFQRWLMETDMRIGVIDQTTKGLVQAFDTVMATAAETVNRVSDSAVARAFNAQSVIFKSEWGPLLEQVKTGLETVLNDVGQVKQLHADFTMHLPALRELSAVAGSLAEAREILTEVDKASADVDQKHREILAAEARIVAAIQAARQPMATTTPIPGPAVPTAGSTGLFGNPA